MARWTNGRGWTRWQGAFAAVALFGGLTAAMAGDAAASSISPAVSEVLPFGQLPTGSTILMRGHEVEGFASAAVVEVDGVAVTTFTRPVLGSVEIVLTTPPPQGADIVLRYASANGEEAEAQFEAVEADTTPPTVGDVLRVTVDEAEQLPFSMVERDVTYTVRLDRTPAVGEAWELLEVTVLNGNDAALRTFGESHREFTWTPSRRTLAGVDPVDVCFSLAAIDGAGHRSETVRACVDEDLREGEGCSVGSPTRGASSALWLLLLLGLGRRRAD